MQCQHFLVANAKIFLEVKNMKKYQRIEDLRVDKDLTQEQIAKDLFVHRTQYQRYESSEGNTFFDFIIRLADYHGVSIDYIAGRTNNKAGIGIKSKKQEVVTKEEEKLIEVYRQMTEIGKARLQERAESILEDEAEQSAMTRGRRSS